MRKQRGENRDPYSRLLSVYLDKIVHNQERKAQILRQLGRPESDLTVQVSFAEFVGAVCKQPILAMNDHWRTQYYQTMQDGISYDFIGRFERLSKDLLVIGARISPKFDKYFISEQRHATGADSVLDKYLTDNLREMISQKFRIDFEYFKYEP